MTKTAKNGKNWLFFKKGFFKYLKLQLKCLLYHGGYRVSTICLFCIPPIDRRFYTKDRYRGFIKDRQEG